MCFSGMGSASCWPRSSAFTSPPLGRRREGGLGAGGFSAIWGPGLSELSHRSSTSFWSWGSWPTAAATARAPSSPRGARLASSFRASRLAGVLKWRWLPSADWRKDEFSRVRDRSPAEFDAAVLTVLRGFGVSVDWAVGGNLNHRSLGAQGPGRFCSLAGPAAALGAGARPRRRPGCGRPRRLGRDRSAPSFSQSVSIRCERPVEDSQFPCQVGVTGDR